MTLSLTRPLTSAEALMDLVLRDGASIAPEYPLVFDAAFGGRTIAHVEDGAVVSACAVLPRELVIGDERVRCGLIGSVVTHPDHRGRGHASRVLSRAETELAGEGCALALLWAEVPELYLERGYGPIGAELDVALPYSIAHRLPAPTGVRPMRSSDGPALHALYAAHATRVERGLEESLALFRCPAMTTLVRTRDERIVAYACLGRGADFGHVIHEWAGGVEDVLPLVRAHVERMAGTSQAPAVWLMAPTAARDLVLALEGLGTQVSRCPLGFGKILDRTATAEVLTRRLAPHGRVQVAHDDVEGPFRVRGPRDLGHLDDEGALGLLVGTPEVRLGVTSFLARFGLEGAQLPLEPFVWGLDSI